MGVTRLAEEAQQAALSKLESLEAKLPQQLRAIDRLEGALKAPVAELSRLKCSQVLVVLDHVELVSRLGLPALEQLLALPEILSFGDMLVPLTISRVALKSLGLHSTREPPHVRRQCPTEMRPSLLLGLWQVNRCWSQGDSAKQITFHCDVDLQNANAAWSREKREWCCENLGIACEEDFHCDVALRNYERAWSLAKKKFCCKTAGVACKGLEDEIFLTTKAPQVDPGNLLAQAPIEDWPEAEGEGKIAEAPDEEP
eukprot:g3127.t1